MHDLPTNTAANSAATTHTPSMSTSTALDGYLQLAQHTTGNELLMVVKQALKDPQTFLFNQLLQLPTIQQLQHSTTVQHTQYYRLLEVFTYGTYDEYSKMKEQLPALSPVEVRKLQQLTVISMVNSSTTSTIPYSHLMTVLHVTTVRQLEDLLIDTMYENLLVGSLDQRYQQLTVVSAIARDINVQQQLSPLYKAIQQWSTHTANKVLPYVQQQQLYHQQAADNELQMNDNYASLRLLRVKELRESTGKKGVDGNDASGSGGSTALHKRAASSLKKMTQSLRR